MKLVSILLQEIRWGLVDIEVSSSGFFHSSRSKAKSCWLSLRRADDIFLKLPTASWLQHSMAIVNMLYHSMRMEWLGIDGWSKNLVVSVLALSWNCVKSVAGVDGMWLNLWECHGNTTSVGLLGLWQMWLDVAGSRRPPSCLEVVCSMVLIFSVLSMGVGNINNGTHPVTMYTRNVHSSSNDVVHPVSVCTINICGERKQGTHPALVNTGSIWGEHKLMSSPCSHLH